MCKILFKFQTISEQETHHEMRIPERDAHSLICLLIYDSVTLIHRYALNQKQSHQA